MKIPRKFLLGLPRRWRHLLALAGIGALMFYLAVVSFQSEPVDESQLMPLLVNRIQPALVSGNLRDLERDIHQLIQGTALDRATLHGLDGQLIASARNLRPPELSADSLRQYETQIQMENTQLAVLTLSEFPPRLEPYPSTALLGSLAAGLLLAVLAWILLNVPLRHLPEKTPQLGASEDGELNQAHADEAEDLIEEEDEEDIDAEEFNLPEFYPPPFAAGVRGSVCLAMVIKTADLAGNLNQMDEAGECLQKIWDLIHRIGEVYGISLIGQSAGRMVLVASGTNRSLALRQSLLFGWNLSHIGGRKQDPIGLYIAPLRPTGDNPCHAWLLDNYPDLSAVLARAETVPAGSIEISGTLEGALPDRTQFDRTESGNLRILEIDAKMLALWKRQLAVLQED